MRRTGVTGLLTLACIFATWAGDVPTLVPARGVISDGKVITCAALKRVGTGHRGVTVTSVPVGEDRISYRGEVAYLENTDEFFWNVRHGAFWCSCAYHLGVTGPQDAMPCIQRYELVPLLKGKLLTAEKANEGIPHDAPFIRNHPIRGERGSQYGLDLKFTGLLFADVVPTGKAEVLQFLLTNFRTWANTPLPPGERLAERPGMENENPKTRPWLLQVQRGRNRWDGVRGKWAFNPVGPDEWVNEEVLEVPFKEEFQAFVRGGDYFFVTKSGKLFQASQAEKDKRRSTRCVWEEPPITAVLTDADADRVYLFCGEKAEGDYFELAGKPTPKPFNLRPVTPSKQEGEVGRLQTLARFLAKEKLLKVPVE
jgi:hypothetical protein